MIGRSSAEIACLAVILVTSGCTRHQNGVLELQCQSADAPSLTARLTINTPPGRQAMIVVQYDHTKPFRFQVVDASTAYYSALEMGSGAEQQPASLYFDRMTTTAIETFRTSNASRDVRVKRCDGVIDAKACKAALEKLVQGPARDAEDCDHPTAAECDSWRNGSNITSEVHLVCHEK